LDWIAAEPCYHKGAVSIYAAHKLYLVVPFTDIRLINADVVYPKVLDVRTVIPESIQKVEEVPPDQARPAI
jgi:hypothetical protein